MTTLKRRQWPPCISKEFSDMIPRINRHVDYYPSTQEGKGPYAAVVTHVWSDTCVNLTVFDPNGNTMGKTSVLLVQPGNEVPSGGHYCCWPPIDKDKSEVQKAAERGFAAKG